MSNEWVVIKYTKTNEVEAVPATWYQVEKQRSLYPDHLKNAVIRKAITNCWPPEKDWSVFSAIKMIPTVFKNLTEADRVANQACITSDLSENGNVHLPNKRKRKPKVFLDYESSSSSSESLNDFPEFPEADVSSRVCDLSEKQESSVSIFRRFRKMTLEILSYVIKQKHETAQLHLKVDNLWRVAENACVMQTELLNLFQNQKRSTSLDAAGDKVEEMFKALPVTSEEALLLMNEKLQDESIRAKLVKDLGVIDGSGLKDSVRRLLKKCIADELAVNYSLVGHKGKKPFHKSNLCKVIIKTVIKNNTACTVKEVEAYMSIWLSKCRERLERKQKMNCTPPDGTSDD